MKYLFIFFSLLIIILFIIYLYQILTSYKSLKIGSIYLDYHLPLFKSNLIDIKSCQWIINSALLKGFQESKIGNSNVNQDIRKSKTCWLSPNELPFLSHFYTYIKTLLPIQNVFLEDLQVVYYNTNDYYKEHYDQCETHLDFCKKDFIRFKGPRFMTIILYLNENYEEGQTFFPRINKIYRGNTGDALFFNHLDSTHSFIHPYSLHQGLPVKKGVKWIANIFIRKII